MMNKEAFLESLSDVLGVSKEKLSEDFELNEDNWDSIAIVSTIAEIDEHFGVTVDTEALTECPSIGALLELIRLSLEQNSPET